MKYRLASIGTLLALALLLVLLPNSNSATAAGSPYDHLNTIQKRLLSGFLSYELNPQNVTAGQQAAQRTKLSPAAPTSGSSSYFPGPNGCDQHLGSNVKVNQNCLNLSDSDLQGRGQAENETAIAVDPNHPNHLVAMSNDYIRGDGTCGAHYSLDGGEHWQDSTVPNGFTRGTAFGGVARQYWQAGGDPSVAWDSKGNAYYDCQVFLRGANGLTNNPDQSSAMYVFRSTQNNGASWNFTGRPVVEYNDVAGSGCCLEDKPYMAVDSYHGSPYQDTIYVTWTEFLGDGTAYIWESHSTDYGETFSSRVLVSGNNTSLCTVTYSLPTPQGNCNENQFSDPFVGPDGALYVAFANFNNPTGSLHEGDVMTTPGDNHYQVLLAKSTDGGASFSLPVQVGNYFDLPDCATYQAGQDDGRACVPEKGSNTYSVFRATNYPAGGVNPGNSHQVVVTYGSYINVDSKEANGCSPNGFSDSGNPLYNGVKTAGACNNKILVSVSTDGGSTFTGTGADPRTMTVVNQDHGQKTTDQWWQWAAFDKNGKFAVSYYDRQYGNDETSGNMDFSLSGSMNLSTFGTNRVTSASMPPPTEFPDAQGNSLFFGDYSGLDAGNGRAHPLWMDTRNVDLFVCTALGSPTPCTATAPNGLRANDEDIFTANMGIPTH